MEVLSLGRKLMQVSKISVQSYARIPSVTAGATMLTIGCSPVVYIQYNVKTAYGEQRPTDTAFRVNPRNHYRVTQFFRNILDWFEKPEYHDMFILNEGDGHLLVNMDYKDLGQMVRGSRYEAQVMLAQPAVYTHDSKEAPGAVVAINRTNYAVCMSDDDIAAIYGVLNSFSFQQEALLLMTIATNPQCWIDQSKLAEVKFKPGTDGNAGAFNTPRKLEW